MKRALIVCPGRGSYGRGELGSLTRREAALAATAAHAHTTPRLPWQKAVDTADSWCRAQGLPSVRELDAKPRFQPSLHLRADVTSPLITSLSYADYLARNPATSGTSDDSNNTEPPWRPVAVIGNSLGWYTALAVAGTLDFSATLRLVTATGSYQHGRPQLGGQLLYPICDTDWQFDAASLDPTLLAPAQLVQSLQGRLQPAKKAAEAATNAATNAGLPAVVRDALAAANAVGFAAVSIHLGGTVVLAADDPGMAMLQTRLPPISRGQRRFPLLLPGHSAFHSELMTAMATAAQTQLATLNFSSPTVPLIDGRGEVWRPLHADPVALRAYTLQTQITTPYDFTKSLTVALKAYAPELIILLGPGRGLGAAIGQTLARLGWRGINNKAGFTGVQRESTAILYTAASN